MYILDKIKIDIAKKINQALGGGNIQASDLVYPPNSTMGDLSLPCFNNKIKPGSIIDDMIELNFIKGVKWAGPYLNFTIDKTYLAEAVIKEIEMNKNDYGKEKAGKKKKVMIEYSNVNTHKQYHIGHLRNICYGDAVQRILSANGYKAIPVSYVNDFGIHVAKTLWALDEYYKAKIAKNNKGEFLGEVYTRAVKELEDHPTGKRLVAMMMKKIETRAGVEYKLWQETRKWSIKQFNEIYKELGVKFKHIFYESEYIDKGRKMVEELLRKKVLQQSEGAVIANLEKEKLGVLLFLRSDGSALYPVADLPLAIEKIKKYKLTKSIYVVDVRQSLYFKQLFKVLEKLGYKQDKAHLSYEFVKLPQGMMSSRSGQVITYRDLRNQALEKAIKETEIRHKDWSAEKIKRVAEKIVTGALKFEMVKINASQIITFDINKALRFDGNTSAYLQYAYARINSIIKKSEVRSKKFNIDFSELKEIKEHELIMKLAKYPDIAEKAGEKYDPSEIAKYLFELAQIFNDYYHSVPVLKAEEKTKRARLVLIDNINQVIKNGLELLGIEVLEEM